MAEVEGYVSKLVVEREGGRIQMKFRITKEDMAPGDIFFVYLDTNPVICLAQMHLLRDALAYQWLTKIHYEQMDWDLSDQYSLVSWVRIRK